MRTGWSILGLAAGLLAASPAARAHELACEKTVNGETRLELSQFPAQLRYTLTIRNIHPTSASRVEEASDPLLESLGFTGFPDDLVIPFGSQAGRNFTIESVKDINECRALAALDGTPDDIIHNVFTVGWDSGSDVCTADVVCTEEQETTGQRMTGGGSVFGQGRSRVTHGFQLRCDADDPRQNLEVNFQGNHFHLTDLTSASCTDSPGIDEGQPPAGFDTFAGTGVGTFNGVPGFKIEFTFTDAGEPGVNDTARIVIRNLVGAAILTVEGNLTFGNHQAHP